MDDTIVESAEAMMQQALQRTQPMQNVPGQNSIPRQQQNNQASVAREVFDSSSAAAKSTSSAESGIVFAIPVLSPQPEAPNNIGSSSSVGHGPIEEIPEIFLPVGDDEQMLDAERSRTVYRDLEDYKFSSDEKTFLCKELCAVHDLLPPTFISTCGTIKIKTVKGLSTRYNISPITLRHWQKLFKEGKPLGDGGGRPPLLDDISRRVIMRAIEEAREQGERMSNETFASMVEAECKATRERRGDAPAPVNPLMNLPTFSVRYLQRLRAQLDPKENKLAMRGMQLLAELTLRKASTPAGKAEKKAHSSAASDIPLCFRPVRTSSSSNINSGNNGNNGTFSSNSTGSSSTTTDNNTATVHQYLDLHDYKFSRAEKLFLCEEISGVHDLLAPTFVSKMDSTRTKKSIGGFCQRYKISRSTLKSWCAAFSEGKAMFDEGGRPPMLDEVSRSYIARAIQEANAREEYVSNKGLARIIAREHLETRKRRGESALGEVGVNVSQRFVQRLKSEFNAAKRPKLAR